MVLLLLVLLMLLLLVLLVLRGRTALRRTILELALVPMLHIRLLLGLLRLIRMLGAGNRGQSARSPRMRLTKSSAHLNGLLI